MAYQVLVGQSKQDENVTNMQVVIASLYLYVGVLRGYLKKWLLIFSIFLFLKKSPKMFKIATLI